MQRLCSTVLYLWLSALMFGSSTLYGQDKHPWVGIANASVFAQRLIDYRDTHGWEELRLSLFADAKFSYERRSPVAERLLYAFLWVDLMYEKESEYVTDWVEKMERANRLHGNMPTKIIYYDQVLGDRLSDGFLKYFFSRADLMREAYNQWEPSDLLTEFFGILDRLYSNNQYHFKQYPALAFAIAFVHDVPPSPIWPHPQVDQDVLPRQLRSADEVFAYYTNPRNVKWFHTSIKRLSLSDAIFLVDLVVSPAEVDWVHKNITVEPEDYEDVYTSIQYDTKRLQTEQFHWLYDNYALSTIYQVGGICVDQAYFASQVGKVQGLPTIEFLGSGLDGRHAWFGYLSPRGKWEMEAGRYADQRFVTGYGFNPQTWSFISDHEIAFLDSGFKKSRTFYSSQLHLFWARLYTHLDDLEKAAKSAENAVSLERRNDAAWRHLIDVRKRMQVPRSRIDATYRSALAALRTYKDLEAKFISEFADYLESTGRVNSAKIERKRITFKNKNSRSDLAVSNAVELLEESMLKDSRSAQMYVYRRILYQVGAHGGIQVLDDLVVPFLDHLIRKGRRGDAKSAILEAEKVLQPAAGSQLARDLQKLKNQVGV